MISNTPLSTLLIRASILTFRSLTPLSLLLTPVALTELIHPHPFSALHPIKLHYLLLLTLPESLFYLLIYLPRRAKLQRPAPQGTDLSRPERRELVRRFLDNVPDMRYFVCTWCRRAPLGEVSRGMVRRWLAWGVLNRFEVPKGGEEGEELDEYLGLVEEGLGEGVTLRDDDDEDESEGPQNGKAKGKGREREKYAPIRVTVDPIRILHRPLLYYVLGVGLIDTLLFATMWRMGFQHYAVRRWFQLFPWRPLSSLARGSSPAGDTSYWYRPHRSRTRRPVLYIHGIGVGLATYTDFLRELIEREESDTGLEEQVGIIAVEVMPISFRLCAPIPPAVVLARQVAKILHQHGWDKEGFEFVLAANSYGTIIAASLLRCEELMPHIGPVLLIDPVTLWAHMGDIAYNFTVKKPKSASEWQLYYFACTDMMAAHTVTRRFVWRDNVLWREELEGKKVGVVLSGADIILDARRLREFLAGKKEGEKVDGVTGAETLIAANMGSSNGWEILWFDNLNHAEVFEEKKERRLLVDIVWKYCCKG